MFARCFACITGQFLEFSLDIPAGKGVAKQTIEATLATLNNAGITAPTKFDDPNCVDYYNRIIVTNMHAVVYLCLASLEALNESHGSIVDVSSILDDNRSSSSLPIACQKRRLAMLTKRLANDFGPHVRVNSVLPLVSLAWGSSPVPAA